jgi:hypothetical protein
LPAAANARRATSNICPAAPHTTPRFSSFRQRPARIRAQIFVHAAVAIIVFHCRLILLARRARRRLRRRDFTVFIRCCRSLFPPRAKSDSGAPQNARGK